MKVEKISAFRSDNEQVWETEKQAIESNIDDIVVKLFDVSDNPNHFQVKEWIKDNKKEIRYILNNIDKIDL